MSRGRGRRDNDLIGQTVRISQGPYKGKVFLCGRCGFEPSVLISLAGPPVAGQSSTSSSDLQPFAL